MSDRASTCLVVVLTAAGLMSMSAGCASAPKGEAERNALQARSNGALAEMKARDPNLNTFLANAYGYAVFPSVGKGGFIIGGGYGRGEVYEQGQFAGFADITQATIGLQAGGQTFAELIAFENKQAMDRFKYGKVKFAANASAVAVKVGASASANYSDGVAVFTLPMGGLMFEAAIGGQEFGFVPATDADRAAYSNSRDNATSSTTGSNTNTGTNTGTSGGTSGGAGQGGNQGAGPTTAPTGG